MRNDINTMLCTSNSQTNIILNTLTTKISKIFFLQDVNYLNNNQGIH